MNEKCKKCNGTGRVQHYTQLPSVPVRKAEILRQPWSIIRLIDCPTCQGKGVTTNEV